jgi:TolB-like protein
MTALLVMLGVGLGAGWLLKPSGPAPDPVAGSDPHASGSVAVLPFDNFAAEDEDYFSDGITEDIIAQLTRVPDLTVISRTSAMRYRNTELSVREIGAELGVGAILEGSVRRADGRVRIVAQLIDVATDRHLWAETYDREIADVFAVQSEVAREIALALGRTLVAPTRVARSTPGPTRKPTSSTCAHGTSGTSVAPPRCAAPSSTSRKPSLGTRTSPWPTPGSPTSTWCDPSPTRPSQPCRRWNRRWPPRGVRSSWIPRWARPMPRLALLP